MRTFRLVERSLQPGCHEILIEGELDLSVADQLKDALERAGSEHDQVLVGLQRCEFIDSTGLAVIVRAHTDMAKQNRRVVVYAPSNQVLRILSITGLTQNGLVFENAAEAIAAAEPA